MNKYSQFVSRSPEIASIVDMLSMMGAMHVPILICGETGSGKTHLAFHIFSVYKHVAEEDVCFINAEIFSSEDLTEQLFSKKPKAVLIENVEFLDHQGQSILKDFCDFCERDQSHHLIATTSASLNAYDLSNAFDKALYHRLNVMQFELPSLQSRLIDLPFLLARFSEEFAAKANKPKISFSAASLKVLKQYPWPGNVREILNLCHRMTLLLPGTVINPSNLPSEFKAVSKEGVQNTVLDLVDKEVDTIKQALLNSAGNKSKAARMLGISRDTLNYRIKKYSL